MEKPEQILNAWLKAVNQEDTESILSLYSEDAILIPTFSNRILDNTTKIRDYFEKLKTRKELMVTLHENTVKIQKITQSIYSICGIYLWQLAMEDELFNFEARFSMILDLLQPGPIIQHHSSQIPRML